MYKSIYSKSKNLIDLFSICADMDEISGQTNDFLDLLDDFSHTDDIALDDDDLSSAAGGIAPINPPKE